MRILILCLLCTVCFISENLAQITGYVYDEQGNTMPYAAVFVEGTSHGTSTNAEGKFSLKKIPQGEHTLVARYVGYRAQKLSIDYKGHPIEVQFNLQAAAYQLEEVVVRASGEDPAYAIMRHAIEKRPYYLDLIRSYSCEVYIKGVMALDEVPGQFMGEKITEDPEKFIDSLDLLYLSETRSEYYVRLPDDRKEIVHSSIVAGSDRGLSFNTAFFLSGNLYENTVELQRDIVSPIARFAMSYYDYKLLGKSVDSFSRTVYKIDVIPKRPEEAVFGGVIYINDSLWNIQSADLYVTGASLNQPIFDTVRLKKTYVPVIEPDAWMPFSHELSFDLSAFGFSASGKFIGIFSNYNPNITFPNGFFDHEMIRYTDSAKKLSGPYWDSIRPIPLSEIESEDYRKKDSLRQIVESPEYIDSVDRAANRFEFMDIISGYSYRRRTKQFSFSIGSPVGITGFDAVRGLYLGSAVSVRWWDESETGKDWDMAGRTIYSFGDEVLRGGLSLNHSFPILHEGVWYVRTAKEVSQFHSDNPVLPLINSVESVLNKVHKLKLYERYGGEAGIGGELAPGFQMDLNLGYFRRNPLTINSSYSLFGKEEPYNSNLPVHPEVDSSFFKSHTALTVHVNLRFTPAQKYIVLPSKRIPLGSRWPTFGLQYCKGIAAFSSIVNYDFISVHARKTHDFGIVGNFNWRVEHGRFINEEQLYFMDYAHFLGNETFIGIPEDYMQGFQMLSYYLRSTTDPYTTIHIEHSFKGFLMDKIPLLNALKWELHIGGRSLLQEPVYNEWAAGIGNIGIGFFRPLRADVVFAFEEGDYTGAGFVLGINLLSRRTSGKKERGVSISF